MANLMHHSTWKRAAALTALFAILLIVVAPQISVALQKDPMSAMPGMHHEMSMMPEQHAMPEHQVMPEHHAMPEHVMPAHQPASQSMPVDHAEACGYCVLLAHVPGVILALIVLLCGFLFRVRITPPRPTVRHWHFSPWLCPDTRAPPRLSAFSL
ncbi:DUF2946 domain-containing protein [Pseudescherichia sp.]|uniref:DUF2946 domain-containing protein n=1 Tax=Pseudescherichia sp. TaxID=2055881 RepID=UPI0028A03288|nr:DUF2946 domain-containing protein [Pseudescherichia sp.]